MQFTTILSILAGASMVMANPVANYGGGSGGGSSTTTTTTNNGQQCGNGNKAYCCGQDALGAILPITCILDIQNCAAVTACCPTNQAGLINLNAGCIAL